VLPGVYVAHTGDLTIGQREIAAALYAGRGCMITGSAALRRQGVRVPLSDTVDVLIPAITRRRSTGFVQIQRTTRMPERSWHADGLLWAPAPRAVADAARSGAGLREVRSFVANAVQQRKCTVAQIASELRAGPSQGSAALRAALEEVADGVASVAEGDLRKLIKNGRLPEPMYNPRLFVGDAFLAQPDVWWAEVGVAVEVDSREWHLSPAAWERTQARHAAMSAHGILVLHYAPRRIRADGATVIAEIRAAIEAGRRRPPLAVRAVPST
jgi:very-short-patch-repair endonuclease